MTYHPKQVGLLVITLLALMPAFAADKEGGTVIREASMYVSPDVTAQRVATVTRGRNIPLIMDRSNIDGKGWVHVLAVVDAGLTSIKEVSGWIDGKLLITNRTPNGDQIIYGEAVDSENQAEQRNGRKHAAEDAMRLYYRIYEYFPNSPLAGESLWRFSDIRWQLEKSGILKSPSAHEMSPDMRTQIDDESMREVIKKFPHTKWADLAAYDMIDNKLCGDWKGETECPEKESDIYEKYAREHPQSPKVAEALYHAAWRQAVLVDMQKGNNHPDKAERARKKALELAQEINTKFPEGDWKPRAATLIYALEQKINVYGSGATSTE
ncbi:MAG TPA: hypothetical protein VKD24_02315 [Candidatus Angelobacter sp.]|nr:hypothetical protein [Candidatus Angelobacter sp.]